MLENKPYLEMGKPDNSKTKIHSSTGGKGFWKRKVTIIVSLPTLLALGSVLIAGMVWIFFLGVILGKGYAPEENIPNLSKIMPQPVQEGPTKIVVNEYPPVAAPPRQEQEASQPITEILSREDLEFRDSLKEKPELVAVPPIKKKVEENQPKSSSTRTTRLPITTGSTADASSTIETTAKNDTIEEEKRAAALKKEQEAKRAAEQKKQSDAKKAAEVKKQAEVKKAAEQKKQAETKQAAEQKKQSDAKKAAEVKKQAETKKAAEQKKQAEAKQAAEQKKQSDAKKAAEVKKRVEAKKAAEQKKQAEAKRAAEQKKQSDAKKAAEAKKQSASSAEVFDYQFQVAAFREKSQADVMTKKLKQGGFSVVTVKEKENNKDWFKTVVRFRGSTDDVTQLREKLKVHNITTLIRKSKTPVKR